MITVKWLKNPQNLNDAFFLREAVFIKEQGFSNEFDETDDTCEHLVLYEDGRPVACARLFEDGNSVWHVGRVAVSRECRGKGYGAMAMMEAEKRAHALGASKICLSAQQQAQGFYEKLGYCTASGLYMDEHCPHLRMEKTL